MPHRQKPFHGRATKQPCEPEESDAPIIAPAQISAEPNSVPKRPLRKARQTLPERERNSAGP